MDTSGGFFRSKRALKAAGIKFDNCEVDPNSQYNRFVSVLRSIVSLDNSIDLGNALNFPDRCLDSLIFAEAKNAYCDQYGQDCNYSSMEWIDKLYLSDVEFNNCNIFRERYSLISQLHMAVDWKPTQVIAAYVSYMLKNHYDTIYPDDFHFVLQVLDIAKNYEESYGDKTIKVFIDHLLLTINSQEAANSISLDAVNLLTMHRSKGLEFKIVFLIGIQAGIIPNDRYTRCLEDLESERRLFYVAITRAKDLLFITSYADPFGVNPSAPYVKHGFMAEIPEVSYSKVIPETLTPAKDKGDIISKSLSSDDEQMLQSQPAIQVAAKTIQETIEYAEIEETPKEEADSIILTVTETINSGTVSAAEEQQEEDVTPSALNEPVEPEIEYNLSELSESQLRQFIEMSKSNMEDALACSSNIIIPPDKYVVIVGATKLGKDKLKGIMSRNGLSYQYYDYDGKGFKLGSYRNNYKCIGIILGPQAHKIAGVEDANSLNGKLLSEEGYPYKVNYINRGITKDSLREAIVRIKWNYSRSPEYVC